LSQRRKSVQKGTAAPKRSSLSRRLDRLVDLARAALFWEKLWRAIMPVLLIAGLFVALSFAGLWLEVTRLWRMAGVGLFALAFVVALLPVLKLGRPSRKEALHRIDRDSGLPHSPASGLDDALANAGEDPATQALWTLHRQRLARNVAALRAGLPSPRMVDFDRYALRAGVLVALLASAFIAGPEKYARIVSAFDWRTNTDEEGGYRIDAWIDPPLYTGKPPVMLKLVAEGASADHAEKISVPMGSTVIIRTSGGDLHLDTTGGLKEAAKAADKDTATSPAAAKPTPAKAVEHVPDDREHRLTLRGDARLAIRHSGALLGVFDLVVIPAKPPRIELTDAPRANLHGSLTLSYKIQDDYGVIGAVADFVDPHVEGVQGRLRSLVAPPRIALVLPPGPGGLGETDMTTDLSDHPWAGARVKMTLTASDEAGNDGKSDPIEITLPEKHFIKPIARALVEQRRDLVLFPDAKDRVEAALESLMIAPEAFSTSASVYLGLDVATRMLGHAKNDTDLLAVADFLWNMALQIENGDLSDAERDLRAAEQQLRDALQRNASDEEIRKLTDNLRAAMDKYLNEFAEQQREQNGQDQSASGPNAAKSISRKDLQAMLDRMQDMARAGDRDDAQKMLEQLQNTLDNLAMAQRGQGNPVQREMSRALSELDKMMREQQNLRDRTHRQGQGQQGQSQPGQGGQARPQGQGQDQGLRGNSQQGAAGEEGEALRQQQQALRNRLEQLQKRLREMGPSEQGLDDARRAMQEAEQGLAQGGEKGNGVAVDAQGRALEAMRRGAEQLAPQMQGQGEGDGTGQGQQEGGTDPLGRPMSGGSFFNPNSRYDPMGMPAAQRAQRVLEELRRRLADPSRSRDEIDYLERLLRRY
jgi:uncharacterized protein (TIGR02302 family)